jgi:hypothetical protein
MSDSNVTYQGPARTYQASGAAENEAIDRDGRWMMSDLALVLAAAAAARGNSG